MKHKFKTNINCGGCIEKVTPFLNREGVETWEVDTQNPKKILSVESSSLSKNEIMAIVQEAGFSIEEEKGGFFSRLKGK